MRHLDKHRFRRSAALLSFALLMGGPVAAEEIDLSSFDLEDLLSMEVTSVSKKSERAFEAPAAAFVITSEDIRRSGMRTIPELLRMVPGVQVAQLSSSFYTISLRGFAGTFSSKLLVLIDGRSVYTPLFAGVFWDEPDLPLADIDRIEVIRGPGGTVWGANAVNGVINIVTKTAAETQGWHVEVGAGNYERAGSGNIRFGGNLADNVDFRVYLKHFEREKTKPGPDINDAWEQIRTGFRMDARIGDSGEFTLQGDLYDGPENALLAGEKIESNLGGGNVLARYTHKFSDTHNASVQFYYDRTDRNTNIINYELDTFDVELKHQIAPLPWLGFVWGGEYRHRNDDSKTANPAGFDPFGLQIALGLEDALLISPSSRKMDLFSGFVQAEGRAWEDKIRLTVGTKLEDNDTSGFEVQPSARLAFVPSETMTLWGSVSRAVRTPSRANDNITTLAVSTTGLPYRSAGNPDTESEDLMAYEAGIRVQPNDWLHFDLAAFYNEYDDLLVTTVTSTRIVDLTAFGLGMVPVAERENSNDADGVAWGIEFFTRVEVPYENEVVKKWWLDGTYSYIDVDLDRDGGTGLNDAPPPAPAGVFGEDDATEVGKTESHHTVGLRSHMSLIHDLEFDLAYFYVSKISDVGSSTKGGKVDSYHRVDLRTAWRPTEHVEASFSVQNLFDGGHREWREELFIPATQVPRTLYGKITLDF